jgi:hypothetical protein
MDFNIDNYEAFDFNSTLNQAFELSYLICKKMPLPIVSDIKGLVSHIDLSFNDSRLMFLRDYLREKYGFYNLTSVPGVSITGFSSYDLADWFLYWGERMADEFLVLLDGEDEPLIYLEPDTEVCTIQVSDYFPWKKELLGSFVEKIYGNPSMNLGFKIDIYTNKEQGFDLKKIVEKALPSKSL